jgi:hypothetical protein
VSHRGLQGSFGAYDQETGGASGLYNISAYGHVHFRASTHTTAHPAGCLDRGVQQETHLVARYTAASCGNCCSARSALAQNASPVSVEELHRVYV